MNRLTKEAIEESTYFVDITFRDEDDEVVVPDDETIFWSLTDKSGSVINSRYYEPETSAPWITVNLEGADLAIHEPNSPVERRLTVEWEHEEEPAQAEVAFLLRKI